MKSRLFTLPLAVATLAFFAPLMRAENEVGFIEKFALAPDREAVLNQLVPGSEDFYFYSALHWQNVGQKEKLAAVMQQWVTRFPNSSRRTIIENRSALLNYETDPQATLKFLRERLNLQFNHQQEVRDKKPDLPSALDAAKVNRAAFLAEALNHGDDLNQFSETALEALVRDKTALKPGQVRTLLGKLTRPDVPGLLDLIVTNLNSRDSGGFGEFPIHRALLPDQLDELARRIPRLTENHAFVYARLRKLAPSADADAEYDPVEREAWFERANAYVQKLSPVFNSLKANLLYRRLQHDRSRGIYNRERFVEYLKLPRPLGYVNPRYLEQPQQQRNPVDLGEDFDEAMIIPRPINNDEALVRDYFLRIFAAEPKGDEGWSEYTQWVREEWLKSVYAEAMVTNGIGSPEKWAPLLSPGVFQALKDRVDVDFAATNQQTFGPADDVTLNLFIKNAPKVIIKIYEINTLSYFLSNPRQLNTDLPLEGLVANRELVQDYSGDETGRNPFRRTERSFKFPELKGQRGAWVIEFIGGGRSSRALVRKGQWSVLQQAGPGGDLITVVDESQKAVPGAVVWLEGRRIAPDEKSGRIIVPYTQQPGTKPIIVADAAGTFACLTSFEHHGEDYALDAQFNVEREQLLAGREATIGIRTALLLHESKLSLDLLKDAKITITTTTLDGVSTTSEVKEPKLEAMKDFVHTIRVPERLATLRVQLTGAVEKLSGGGEKMQLMREEVWAVNGIDKTSRTAAGYLNRFENDYVYELLGKNGEPLADRQVVFTFTHREFSGTVRVPLRTDEKGRVQLGALSGLALVRAENSEQAAMAWRLSDAERTWPAAIHARAGEEIRVPWTGSTAPQRVSLLETRAGTFVADRSNALGRGADGKLPDPSTLTLKGLTPGDYSLLLDDHAIEIRITAGEVVQNWIVSRNRELQIVNAAPLNIASVTKEADALVVQLVNPGAAVRVHVVATRFLGDTNLFASLGDFVRFNPEWQTPARNPNLYTGGREIGDEYRYILERRFAKLFPGNMLPRPGLLLNPWDLRSTDLQRLSQAAQEAAARVGGGRGVGKGSATGAASSAFGASKLAHGDEASPNIDFLAVTAPVIYNLVPDEKGVIRIDRKALGDRQYVQIYAGDLSSAVWRTVALAEVPTKFQDLRLARYLDPQKPFTEKKEITVLATGQTLTLADILTSEIESYDSLSAIHGLLTTLNKDANFAKFAWVLDWPKMKDAEKQAKYSEFACHELNFFIARKDPDFFQKVVQPYLRNKKDKTFMDDYLLGNDLRSYLDPWSFERLNMTERALLGQKIAPEAAGIGRHLRDLWDLLPPDPAGKTRLFETGLKGRAQRWGVGGGAGGGGGAGEMLARDRAFANLEKPAPPTAAPAPSAPRGATLRATGVAPSEPDALQAQEEMKAESAARADFAKDKMAKNAPMDDSDMDGFFAMDQVAQQRQEVRQFFRALGPTKEWAENNYYRLPIAAQDASLVRINAFWRDYAAWDGKTPFVSRNIAEASRSFSEMMFALSVLDLPFEAPKHTMRRDGGQFTITAAGPLIVFHQEIKPAAPAGGNVELLVSQNYFRNGERYRDEGNEKFDKYVTSEFLAGVVYGANIVVTNPTSSPQKLDVLMQIPQGALPVSGSKATDSREVRIEAYTTQTFLYYFYFPLTGAEPFVQFPVNVARNEQAVGAAKPVTFKVVQQLSEVDKTSWDYVSQYGTDADVFAFLEKANLGRTDLVRIAWRARQSADFFRKLVAVLAQRHIYNDVIYSYAVVHNDTAALGEWLQHRNDFIAKCGPWLNSKLVKIDPIERRAYQHLEYSPLVNQRAYKLGSEIRIANPVLRGQYQSLLNILAYKPTLEAMDQMSVVYYLFLQDRVEEALAKFHTIKPETLPTRLQHDYFRCYAAFYEEQLPVARGVASQYTNHPVDRWKKIFAEVTSQLDEIEGKAVAAAPGTDGPKDRETEQGTLAATEPSFDFKVENRQIALTWKNLKEVTVNYYLMDPEFLFSSSPFVTQDPGRFSIIKPAKSSVEKLPEGKETLDLPLPGEFAKANVLVEILGAGQRKAQAYHANTLRVVIAENYGRLELRDQAAGKPVSKAYVKVYARLNNGTIRFFKDGNTDLRGKFDYASLNSSEGEVMPAQQRRIAPGGGGGAATLGYQMIAPSELNSVTKLSILIMSDEHGTVIREANPPAQ